MKFTDIQSKTLELFRILITLAHKRTLGIVVMVCICAVGIEALSTGQPLIESIYSGLKTALLAATLCLVVGIAAACIFWRMILRKGKMRGFIIP